MSLDEIRERWNKATPGPWQIVQGDVGDEDYLWVPAKIVSEKRTIIASEGGFAHIEETWHATELWADAEAIAHAPQDIQTLLQRIDADVEAMKQVAQLESYGLDEDIPDDKESAYKKGYNDAICDAWGLLSKYLRKQD